MNGKTKARTGSVSRSTTETTVEVDVNLDGCGEFDINTPYGFFTHMLELFTFHAGFDLHIKADGDTEVDGHHLVEDVGIALGEAFSQAVNDKKGIKRYADIHLPMDEALVLIALDISGRGNIVHQVDYPNKQVGSFDITLLNEFFTSFTREGSFTLHVRKLAGDDTHHIAEAIFKGLGRTLGDACIESDNNETPSTKGRL